MDLGRATRFGSVGAIGVILISLGTAGVMGMAWADRISSSEGMALGSMMIIGIAGTAFTIVFLFVVIGAFLDRELEARGLDRPEE
jgi:hypothetical protein